jgi:Ca2+-binding EF-hand superfamily protein
MLSTLTSPLDFPAFLTYISNLTSLLSSREELRTAFASFDDNDTGLLNFLDMKTELMATGSMRMTEEQVDMALGGFVERTGKMKGKVMYEKLLDSMVGEQPVA